jgi:hypothetical protein
MEKNPDRLYELLPYIYRLRDSEQNYTLQALLRVITEQVNLVEADIDRLYDNWFIETCEEWLVPYIGDLVGYRLIDDISQVGDDNAQRERSRFVIPRRDVANTIRYRRRKGTLALLELLARDVAGWPARAVEFHTLLYGAQAVNHLRLDRGRSVDMRHGLDLSNANGPFDTLAHLVDVRRIQSTADRGRYNPPAVGVFAWRLKVYPVTYTEANCLEDISPSYFAFSVLGNDTPLYNRPDPETDPNQIAGELNLPTPIRRRQFEDRSEDRSEIPPASFAQASADYYGMQEDPKSLLIWAPNWPEADAPQPLPRSLVIPTNLNDWAYNARENQVLVDPELGRMVFPEHQLPPDGVIVSYHYAFSDDIGGGEYARPISQPEAAQVYPVASASELTEALKFWQDPKEYANQPANAVIEITRSGEYSVAISIHLREDHTLQIRAASGVRPVLRLGDVVINKADAFTISGEKGSRLILDGLLIFGRGLRVNGPKYDKKKAKTPPEDLCHLVIRHSTLVPGWKLDVECEPKRPNEPSLELNDTGAKVTIEHSIIGSIYALADKVRTDPLSIHLSDSILDATGFDCDQPSCVALAMPGGGSKNWRYAHAVLSMQRCTVFGRIYTHAVELAQDSIFMGPLKVARRQFGCVRFCYLAPGSRTPVRFRCQPDLVEAQVLTLGLTGADLEQEREGERLRVRPQFNSTRFGTPTYAQLATSCAEEITRGAQDSSEMGVFHNLYQPQRTANLQRRLEEYTPAGTDAGIIFAS